MAVSITLQDITGDGFKETLGKMVQADLGDVAQALQNSVNASRGLADASADRAALAKALYENLDSLTMYVNNALSTQSSSGLSAEIQATLSTYRTELGKAESFFKSAGQLENFATFAKDLGKNVGSIMGAADFLLAAWLGFMRQTKNADMAENDVREDESVHLWHSRPD